MQIFPCSADSQVGLEGCGLALRSRWAASEQARPSDLSGLLPMGLGGGGIFCLGRC